MQETSIDTICELLKGHRSFFATQQTKDIVFRINQLKLFRQTIRNYELKITDALKIDLHKSADEVFLTEISIVLQEIDNHILHLKKWATPKAVRTPAHLFPASGKVLYEPLGVSLIIAPWNYPFQLLMGPLIGSISAGCCAMLKPSPYTPTIAAVMEEMIHHCFDKSYISVVQGGRDTNRNLLEQRFDLIFFTGSPALGKVVMRAAAEHLTPVILELGGKSPCIVDRDADIEIAAKRIAWGKMINAGQTCIAPDYLFAHRDIKDKLIASMQKNIVKWYGANPQKNNFYPRIVTEQAVNRLQKLMSHGEIILGGGADETDRYIAPTIIDGIEPDFPIMQEEIFGPILPVMGFNNIESVISYINSHEKPLALYYFGEKANAEKLLRETSSGGVCINDTLMHITNHHLPFGGVGNSGMGKYHGKASFLAFSHPKAVVHSPSWFDLPVKYVPFRFLKYFKLFLSKRKSV